MEKSPVEVASYSNPAFEGTWSGRSRGLWGISLLGLLSGVSVGVIAPFFPALVGEASFGAAASHILPSMAVFGAAGIGFGYASGTMLGAAAGAASTVAREQERRMRERDMALGISTPEQEAAISQWENAVPPDTRSGWQKFEDGVSTYFNPKVGILFTGLGMIAGGVMAAAYFALGQSSSAAMPAMDMLVGVGASQTAVTAYFVGLMGTFGALWNFNYPRLAMHMQDTAGQYLNGKALGTHWGPEPELSHAPLSPPAVMPERSVAEAAESRASFRDMLALQEQNKTPDTHPPR